MCSQGFGLLMILGTIKATAYSHQLSAVGGPGLGWIWVFAIGFVSISSLGIYAANTEKPFALKTFAGFMGIGKVIVLIFGIIVVNERNQVIYNMAFWTPPSDLSKHFIAENDMRALLEEIQETMQYCRVVRAEVWGYRIPNSCECSRGYDCKSKPQGTSGKSQIYLKTCGEFLYSNISPSFETAIAFCFVLAVIAFLGLHLPFLMIHQVKRDDSTYMP
ncbi:hypothetical protein Q8A73_021774 [Channa argus]|nr:hypothetical protein Q8A73_021774 [Channa argus]